MLPALEAQEYHAPGLTLNGQEATSDAAGVHTRVDSAIAAASRPKRTEGLIFCRPKLLLCEIRIVAMPPLNVCVYGSSSSRTPERYLAAARDLGGLLARRGDLCINGAGANGVMGALNSAIRAAGGRVRGVCHERFVDGAIDALFTGAAGMELVVARGTDLSARKRALACDADCIVALPGGPGTWDELWEAAALRQIGFESAAPVCVVNVDGYYDGFGTMLARAHADGILHKPPSEFLFFARDAAEALAWCEARVRERSVPSSIVGEWRGFARLRTEWRGFAFGVIVGALLAMRASRSASSSR